MELTDDTPSGVGLLRCLLRSWSANGANGTIKRATEDSETPITERHEFLSKAKSSQSGLASIDRRSVGWHRDVWSRDGISSCDIVTAEGTLESDLQSSKQRKKVQQLQMKSGTWIFGDYITGYSNYKARFCN